MIKDLAAAFLTVILVDNLILSKLFGISLFIDVERRTGDFAKLGVLLGSVLFFSSMAAYPLYNHVLIPTDTEYLGIFALVAVTVVISKMCFRVVEVFCENFYPFGKVYFPIITTNSIIIGGVLLNSTSKYGFISAAVSGLGGGLGIVLAIVMFSGVKQRMAGTKFPKSFEGVPVNLIAASLVSLSMMGFSGVIEGIFR